MPCMSVLVNGVARGSNTQNESEKKCILHRSLSVDGLDVAAASASTQAFSVPASCPKGSWVEAAITSTAYVAGAHPAGNGLCIRPFPGSLSGRPH